MKSNKFHHAFRINYNGITNQLITECAIALPFALDQNLGKKFHPFKALWDTGATNSVITQKIVTELQLIPTGLAETQGVHGKSKVNTYIVDIGLPSSVCFQNVVVSEGVSFNNFDLLIGMDIIQAGDFAIANANGKTTFSFCHPAHDNPIDLLEKSDKINPKKVQFRPTV